MNPVTICLSGVLALVGMALFRTVNPLVGAPFVVVAIAVLLSLKMANTWQKFVILRAGKLQGVRGPGLFWIIPVVDSVTAVVDERIQTTAFNAERALTKDLSITHKWRPVRAGLPGANRV